MATKYDINYLLKRLPEIRHALRHVSPDELETGRVYPSTGDCGNIACALNNILEGDNKFYALYRIYRDPESDEEYSEPFHILLKVGDKLMDFEGERTPEDILYEFEEQRAAYPKEDKFVVKPIEDKDIESALDYFITPARAQAIEHVMRKVLEMRRD